MLTERCVGQFWALSTARMLGCTSLSFLGEYRLLKERLVDLVEGARARGNLYEVASLEFRSGHTLLLADDRPDEAQARLSEALFCGEGEGRFYVPHWWACMGKAEIALYRGEPRAGLDALRRGWGGLRNSRLLAMQHIRIFSRFRVAQCGIALARTLRAGSSERRGLLRAAERNADRLGREGAQWASPLARLVRMAIAAAEGANEVAASGIVEAEAELLAVDMRLFAAATRRWRGELQGGASGRVLVEEADAALRDEGVVDPIRMRRMLVPA